MIRVLWTNDHWQVIWARDQVTRHVIWIVGPVTSDMSCGLWAKRPDRWPRFGVQQSIACDLGDFWGKKVLDVWSKLGDDLWYVIWVWGSADYDRWSRFGGTIVPAKWSKLGDEWSSTLIWPTGVLVSKRSLKCNHKSINKYKSIHITSSILRL